MKSSLFHAIFISMCLLKGTTMTTAQSYPPGKEVLYYGFFFDEIVAASLKNVTDTYFEACINKIPECKEFMESVIANANVSNIHEYFTKPLDPNESIFDPFYHVTAKYCGEEDCSEYRNGVVSHLNKDFEMNLIGYYFTKRTFGVRVHLTLEQEQVYDNYGTTSKNWKVSDKVIEISQRDSSHTPAALPGIRLEDVPPPINFNPTNNIAHITLGCAPNISAVVTGADLGKIITFEKDSTIPKTNFSIEMMDVEGDLRGSTAEIVRYSGSEEFGEAFVIYPNVKILANAKFQQYLKPVSSPSASIVCHSSVIILLFCIFLCLYL